MRPRPQGTEPACRGSSAGQWVRNPWGGEREDVAVGTSVESGRSTAFNVFERSDVVGGQAFHLVACCGSQKRERRAITWIQGRYLEAIAAAPTKHTACTESCPRLASHQVPLRSTTNFSSRSLQAASVKVLDTAQQACRDFAPRLPPGRHPRPHIDGAPACGWVKIDRNGVLFHVERRRTEGVDLRRQGQV